MWDHATLYLRPDVSADDKKAVIEQAKWMIGSEDFKIEMQEAMPWQAQLSDQNGQIIILDSQLMPYAARLTVSQGGEDNDYIFNALLFKPH
jgi:hypothetical protein